MWPDVWNGKYLHLLSAIPTSYPLNGLLGTVESRYCELVTEKAEQYAMMNCQIVSTLQPI